MLNLFSQDWLASVAYALGLAMAVEVIFFALLKSRRNRDFKTKRIYSLASAAVLLGILGFVKERFYTSLDSLPSLLGLVLAVLALLPISKKFLKSNILQRNIADYSLLFLLVITSSLTAENMSAVEISRFFGRASLSRFALINLPFIVVILFLFTANLRILARAIMGDRKAINGDSLETACFIGISLLSVVHFSLPSNIFAILSMGILGSFISQEMEGKWSSPALHLFANCAITATLFFSATLWGGFYGLALSALGLSSAILSKSCLSEASWYKRAAWILALFLSARLAIIHFA